MKQERQPPAYPNENKWYVIYVKSRTEKKVRDRLTKKNINVFLPLMKVVRQWSDRKKTVQMPLFSGYLFVFITPEEFTLVKMVEGVVGFVKQEGKNAIAREEQVEAVRLFIETGMPVEATSDEFIPGENVRINFGPLKGYEGELVSVQNEKHFIMRINVINQVLKVSMPAAYLEKI